MQPLIFLPSSSNTKFFSFPWYSLYHDVGVLSHLERFYQQVCCEGHQEGLSHKNFVDRFCFQRATHPLKCIFAILKFRMIADLLLTSSMCSRLISGSFSSFDTSLGATSTGISKIRYALAYRLASFTPLRSFLHLKTCTKRKLFIEI